MRIVCISESARTDGDFSWLDFANSSGRLDVIARCAQLILREKIFHPILTEVKFILTNSIPQKTLNLNLRNVQNQNQISEYTIAQDFKELFTCDPLQNNLSHFFHLSTQTLEDFLEAPRPSNIEINQDDNRELLILEEGGIPVKGFKSNFLSSTVIIGDQNGFSDKTMKILRKYQGIPISLGKNSYLSSHSLFLILLETLKRTKQQLQP